MGAVKREHFIALAREHAPHLMIASLGENEFGRSGVYDTQLRRQAGGRFAGQQQIAAREKRAEFGAQLAVKRGAVGLRDFVLWRSELVHERGLVGEEQQAARIFVETTDARDLGVALAPACGKQAVDVWAFVFVVGADEAGGFV